MGSSIVRSVAFDLVRAEVAGDGLTMEGYGAVFDSPTLIDSWEGTFHERIRKGAFKKTIRDHTPVIQFDHGQHPLIGSIPIGRIQELREDDRGLFVAARLSDNWLIEPVRIAIADGAISGMSFRFRVIRDEWRDVTGKLLRDAELMDLLWSAGDRGPLERTLTEVRMEEVGPVVFPAYPQTTVGVRAREVAEEIKADDRSRREVRRSLARAIPVSSPDVEDLSDPELRREVASALLFDDAPPPDGHPSSDHATRCEDAPPAAGHPSEGNDAPPLDGHPSTPESTRTDLLRSQIREITEAMEQILAPIAKED